MPPADVLFSSRHPSWFSTQFQTRTVQPAAGTFASRAVVRTARSLSSGPPLAHTTPALDRSWCWPPHSLHGQWGYRSAVTSDATVSHGAASGRKLCSSSDETTPSVAGDVVVWNRRVCLCLALPGRVAAGVRISGENKFVVAAHKARERCARSPLTLCETL